MAKAYYLLYMLLSNEIKFPKKDVSISNIFF